MPGAPVRKKSNAALIWTIVITCVFCLCILPIGGFLWFKSNVWNKVATLGSCAVGFEDVRLAILDYAKSHDGKLPDAATWQDSVRSYYQDEVNKSGMKDQNIIPTMNAQGPWGCPPVGEVAGTGMSYNPKLSGKTLKSIDDPYSTVLVFEIPTPTMNAHEEYKDRGKTGPEFFGTHRDWLVEYMRGDLRGMSGNSSFRTNRNNGEDPYDSAMNADKSSDSSKGSDKKNPDDSTKSDSSSSSDN
jgi:hypothetical protein